MATDPKFVEAPEAPGFRRANETIDGRKSFYVTVTASTAILAKDEADARRMFETYYVRGKPNGDYGSYEMRVSQGPPIYLPLDDEQPT